MKIYKVYGIVDGVSGAIDLSKNIVIANSGISYLYSIPFVNAIIMLKKKAYFACINLLILSILYLKCAMLMLNQAMLSGIIFSVFAYIAMSSIASILYHKALNKKMKFITSLVAKNKSHALKILSKKDLLFTL